MTKLYNRTGWPTDATILRVGPHGCIASYAMRSHQDAIALREIFVSTLQSNDLSLKVGAAASSLRIDIANCAGQKRSILNANAMLKTSQDTFSQHQVVLHYFENSTFQEQVNVYSQLDVAVSPRGAQLTGIMFMAP